METLYLYKYSTIHGKTICSDISTAIRFISEHCATKRHRLHNRNTLGVGLQFMTSEERYNKLILDYPEVLQRVSLTDIASYLGISRETLSRIRRKK